MRLLRHTWELVTDGMGVEWAIPAEAGRDADRADAAKVGTVAAKVGTVARCRRVRPLGRRRGLPRRRVLPSRACDRYNVCGQSARGDSLSHEGSVPQSPQRRSPCRATSEGE